MTREEFRDYVDFLCLQDEISYDVYSELIDGIDTLEQEPCEDAISRQAVLDYIDKMPNELTADGRRMIRRRTLEEYISDTLPPVTPTQKYGKWIDREEYDADRWKCSECGRTEQYQEKFCPNCGAKMQESKETGEIHCNHTDTEIAKSFIEDVEAVKELLPKAEK